MTINAVHAPCYRRPRQIAQGDMLATALGLDMAEAGWTVTADSYLGRVTTARIMAAVREAVPGTGIADVEGMRRGAVGTEMLDAVAPSQQIGHCARGDGDARGGGSGARCGRGGRTTGRAAGLERVLAAVEARSPVQRDAPSKLVLSRLEGDPEREEFRRFGRRSGINARAISAFWAEMEPDLCADLGASADG